MYLFTLRVPHQGPGTPRSKVVKVAAKTLVDLHVQPSFCMPSGSQQSRYHQECSAFHRNLHSGAVRLKRPGSLFLAICQTSRAEDLVFFILRVSKLGEIWQFTLHIHKCDTCNWRDHLRTAEAPQYYLQMS